MKVSSITIAAVGMVFLAHAVACRAIDQSICTPGEISYYPGGQLKSCTLKDDVIIGGVKCKQYAPVNLYQTGTLQSCVTSDYFNYEYSRVSFHANGKLDTCILSKSLAMDGKSCAPFEAISLFENGKLRSCSAPH